MCKVYKDLDEVLEKIFEEWDNIPLKMINNLIDGHCAEVYKLKGGFK